MVDGELRLRMPAMPFTEDELSGHAGHTGSRSRGRSGYWYAERPIPLVERGPGGKISQH